MRIFVPLGDVEKRLNQKLTDDNYFEGGEIQMMLQKAILTLPEKQRIVFNLRYYNEMPYEQMSEVLGTSVGALKASYHLAMKKVEKSLTGN
jgi:RNA polymerase sigma-70 factor (ECF subfamily)